MSKYTTGELAKLCGVSVRTVQYYDTRGILVPSELSEGGRRLYSDGDLNKMKIICFLRELDLPIDGIKKLLREKDSEAVISLLLNEQEKLLHSEIGQKQAQAEKIAEVKRALTKMPEFSLESIGDIAHIMENKRHLRKLRIKMLVGGLIMDAIEVTTLLLWVLRGIWVPFAIGMTVAVAIGIWISAVYFKSTAYICPQCHTVFKSLLREAFFARHTPNTRRLTCPHCARHGFCVETYRSKEKSHAEN